MGRRESYSEDAYKAHCRHRRSNYEALKRDLDRFGHRDRVFYEAIRVRVDGLVEEDWVWVDEAKGG